MNGANKLRIALVAGAVVLTIGIYLLPKDPLTKTTEQKQEQSIPRSSSFSMERLIKDSKMKMGWNADHKISEWEKALSGDNPGLAFYDSIGLAWDAAQIPGIAAWYFEEKAGKSTQESDWLKAAYRYFDAFKAAKDSSEAGFFAEKAIHSYSEVLKLNPKNQNAKVDLGVLYAESTAEPMKGIMLLREVVTENPNHENANLNLGFLSMRSGQFEKAVERFKKVLEINPSRIDMHVYIGEAYLRLGNKEKAIENFEIFKNLSNDQAMIKEVNTYIENIKAGSRQ